jgi:hypothetical protein
MKTTDYILQKNPSRPRAAFSTALSILALLVAVYSLAYTGAFLTDDEHILATQSLSMAFDDSINFSRVMGNTRIYEYTAYPTPTSTQALNIEPGQAFFGSILAKAAVRFGTGQVQTMYLLNVWVTALTAAVIFLTARIMNWSTTTGLILAAYFGLGTTAFPYAKTYFRDPLAALFLACAWLFAAALIQPLPAPPGRRRQGWLWVGLLASLAAGTLAKNTVLIALPVVLLQIVVFKCRHAAAGTDKRRSWLTGKNLILFSGGILAMIGLWIVAAPRVPALARFTPQYYAFLIKFFLTTPRPNLLAALLGPLISPGKSLLIFSPVLILAVFALFRHFKSSWPAWLYLFLLILAQALFYDAVWAGHINWGLRYIIPAIPPLLLTVAPVIERWLQARFGRLALWITGLVGFFIQLSGVLVPVRQYFVQAATSSPPVSEHAMTWDVRQSIIGWGVRWIAGGQPLDLALARTGLLPAALILSAALGVVALAMIGPRKKNPLRWGLIAIIGALGLNMLMLHVFKSDPQYASARTDLQQAHAEIAVHFRDGDALLLKTYGSPAWAYWMNWSASRLNWTSLPYAFPSTESIDRYRQTQNPEDALDKTSLAILQQAVASSERVWLLVPYDSPGASLGLEKAWLAGQSRDVACSQSVGQGGITELCAFEIHQTGP